MRNLWIIKGLLFVILFIPTTTLAAGKHALLIGIQNYPNTAFPSLKAPAKDIALMKWVLRKRFGFQDKDFIILKDAQATHTGIEKAFTKLARRVCRGDFVYLYYSGHGSVTKDCNGDEPSDKDQTWVAYGARSSNRKHKDNYDILDDEIAAWLKPIYAKTGNVVFVSDSCHSASVSRAEAAIIKAVPPDKRPHPSCNTNTPYPKVRHRGVHIGAARDDQLATEVYFKKRGNYSLFTWYWAKALQNAQANKTWKNVFDQTYSWIKSQGKEQAPQFSQFPKTQRKSNRFLRLGSDFSPQPKTVKITQVFDDLTKIDAGLLANVTKGSVYRLYKPQSPKSQNLPRLTITRVADFTSLGKVEGRFKTGDLVVEEQHVYPFEPIKVYLKVDRQSLKKGEISLLQTIRSAFNNKRFPAYTLTHNPRHAEQLLYLSRPMPEQSAALQILTPEGQLLHEHLTIPFHHPNSGLVLLQENLNQLAHIRELKLLGTDSADTLPGDLQISHLTRCEQPHADCIQSERGDYYQEIRNDSWQAFQGKSLHKDDVLVFEIRNRSDKQYCFYLLEISPNGMIQAIFPTSDEVNERYACIKAHQKWRRIQPLQLNQTGETWLKLIASRQPIAVSLLEKGEFSQYRGARKNLNPLERLLLNATRGRRTAIKLPTTGSHWAASQILFEVK